MIKQVVESPGAGKDQRKVKLPKTKIVILKEGELLLNLELQHKIIFGKESRPRTFLLSSFANAHMPMLNLTIFLVIKDRAMSSHAALTFHGTTSSSRQCGPISFLKSDQ